MRRRPRRSSDGQSAPLQLQVLEADFLDATKSGVLSAGPLVQGIEFDPVGKRRGPIGSMLNIRVTPMGPCRMG